MVAHVAGNAGGPPPPTQREARLLDELRDLHAQVERLLLKLGAAQKVIEACRVAARYDYDDAGVFRINGALDAYDRFIKEITQ